MPELNAIDRRHHERFALMPMYSGVTVQRVSELRLTCLEGHAYDISESGVRIELDEPLQVGERVTLHLELPAGERSIPVTGRVVWVNDDQDDPGPRRMAVQFIDFTSDDDRTRLHRYLGNGLARRAA